MSLWNLLPNTSLDFAKPFGKGSHKPGDTFTISKIMIYPIKSCAGVELQSSAYDKEGFEFDRKWMIVDLGKNMQLSARDNRGLKLVRIFPQLKKDASHPSGGVLQVTFPDSPETPSFSLPLNPSKHELSDWEIHDGFDLFGASCEGLIAQSVFDSSITNPSEDSPSEILSEYIGRSVLLIMKNDTPRAYLEGLPYDKESLQYEGGSTIRYPDLSPFLLASTASLEDAAEKTREMAEGPKSDATTRAIWGGKDGKKLLAIERFRPNVIVDGVKEPFGEDDWLEIEGVDRNSNSQGTFTLPMRCPRCMFPNVDPETGTRDTLMPNKAMMAYRRVEAIFPTKYCVGMAMIPTGEKGVLTVGDHIVVRRSAPNPKFNPDTDKPPKGLPQLVF